MKNSAKDWLEQEISRCEALITGFEKEKSEISKQFLKDKKKVQAEQKIKRINDAIRKYKNLIERYTKKIDIWKNQKVLKCK